MLVASPIFLALAYPIACGILGGAVGLWIGSKLPVPDGWRRRRMERTASSAQDDPEMAAVRKRAHEIARESFPELVR